MAIGMVMPVTEDHNDNNNGGDNEEGEKDKLTGPLVRTVCCAAIGGLLFGYDTGIVSGAMVFLRDDFALSDEWQEILISSAVLSSWLSVLSAGHLSRVYGRRLTVLISSVTFVIGSVVMAVAHEVWTMLLGRLVVGIGIGLSSIIVPLYIAELAPTRIRGSLVTANSVFITGGQAVASVVAVGLSFLPEDIGWRLMLGIGAVPAAVQALGFLFLPESPRWLVQMGRVADANVVLQRMRGGSALSVDRELGRIVAEVDSENQKSRINSDALNGSGFFHIMRRVISDDSVFRALTCGCLLQVTQQLTGISSVMYYAASIIQMSGVMDKRTAVSMASIAAIVNFVTTIAGAVVVDHIGRRKLLLLSLTGVCLSLAFLTTGFTIVTVNSKTPVNASVETTVSATSGDEIYTTTTGSPSLQSLLVLIGLCVYLLCFGPGIGAMPWTINSEIYPLWCRTTCLSVSTSVNWLFSLIVSLSFLSLTRVLTSGGTFFLYLVFGMTGCVYFYAVLPETRGRSLEDTKTLFQQKSKKTNRT